MDLLIVGAGEMGRWFAGTVAAHADGVDLAFADADRAVAEAAADATGGRAVPLDPDDAGRSHDAVCIAVPMSVAEDAVATHADRAERAIVDVTGTMTVVSAMRTHAPDSERLSLHPLFAASNAPGNVAAVADQSGPTTDRIRGALEAAGNAVFETTVAEHERAMETVQATTHAAVLAFALAADPVREEFATPVFADLAGVVETVTGNDPAVYAEIQERFDGAEALARAAERIADADRAAFEAAYREATVPIAGERADDADDTGDPTVPDDTGGVDGSATDE